MEANRSQGGIQQLLAAEQEAQQIVNAARNGRAWSIIHFFPLCTCSCLEDTEH